MAESAEEATAKAEQFKAVMDDLNDQYSGDNAGMIWSKEDTQAFNNAKMNYEGYIKLAEELTQANAEMGESGVDAANLLSNATNEYVGSMQTVLDQYQATYEATLANIDKWFSPFEKVSKQQKHTFDEMKTGLQSQIDFYGNFNDTIQTLTDSGLGSMSKMFVDMGPEGISWANSIVEALDKAGGATSEKGQGIIQDLIRGSGSVSSSTPHDIEWYRSMSCETTRFLRPVFLLEARAFTRCSYLAHASSRSGRKAEAAIDSNGERFSGSFSVSR